MVNIARRLVFGSRADQEYPDGERRQADIQIEEVREPPPHAHRLGSLEEVVDAVMDELPWQR